MPRSVPAGITAKQNNTPGAGVSFLWLWLVEIHFSGGSTVYYSSGQTASFGGNTYVANKVTELSGLTAQYIDRKRRDFGSVTITLDNLAEGGSSAFPVTVLEGSLDPAEARVFVHLFDAFSGAGVDAIWQGYVKDRQYDSENYTVTVNASFLWDSPGIVIPSSTLQQNGFSELDSNSNKENLAGDTALPLYWGAGPIKIRPTIWHTRVRDSEIQINGIISGTGPTPFNVNDITADGMKLFDVTKASRVDFRIGAAADTAPPDRTAFPDGLAHNNVAHFSARFPITDANKDKTDNISADDVRMTIANGRPLISTSLPSGNGILIMQDGLRDVSAGLGMPGTDFDDLTASAAACGSRWQCRVEMHDQISVGDWVQNLCGQIHGFVTFNGRKCQLGIKLPTETPIATFATLKSGQSGRRVNGKVRQWFEAADQAKNQVNVKYRLTNRHEKELIAYDNNAQGRAGGTIRKVEKDDVAFNALYQAAPDPVGGPYGQVAIAAATIIREEQNLNLFIEVRAPLAESLDVAPGDLIRCWSENISNNGTNNVFRIIAQTFEGGADPQSVMTCQVYFGVVYNYGVGGIGIDLIRGGSDISTTGRPPDVENVALALIEKVTHDTEGSEAHIRGSWTWPVVDLAGDAAAGVVREFPIKSVLTKWRFTDEGANEWKHGKETAYPSTFGDFNVPYLKSKTVQVEFVALGLNGSQGVDGYVADPTKTVLLEGDWSSTAPAFFCSSPAGIIVAGDYVKTEFEINKVVLALDFGGGHGQINVEPNASPRTAFFDTVPIAHPSGTQVAKAKQNYPVASLSLSPARFNYPAVTQLALHQRALAVKVVIGDVNTQNVEDYATYWTIDPTKLSSLSPAWYLANPLAPPVGVNIILGKALHFEIAQELIGPAGTVVYAQCAARNGKHNWSGDGAGNPLLSPVVNNSVGDNLVPVANQPRLVPKKRGLRIVEPMPTLNMKTFPTAGKVEVVIRARNGGGAILGYLTDASGDFASQAAEYRFNFGLMNAQPLPIGQDTILAIWPTAATLEAYVYISNAVGTSLASPLSLPVNVATWEVLLEGAVVPGLLKFPTVFVATPDVSSLSINTVDGDPAKAMARLVFDIYTANLLGLDVNNVDAVAFAMIERNSDNTADIGSRFSQELTLGISPFNNFGRTLYLPMGRRYRLLQVISINGDKRAVADGIMDFVSGNVITVAPGDSKVVPAPTFISQPAANGNKIADFTIRLVQNGTDVILFKLLNVELSYGGGPYKSAEGYPMGLIALDDLHVSPAGSHDFAITCKRKPGVTLDVRASAKAIGSSTGGGGKLSAITNAVQLVQSTDDLGVDTGFPNNGTAIALTHAAIKNGRTLISRFVMPSLQMAQHVTNYLILHDNNQTGAGRKFFEPASQSWVTTYSDGTTQMDIGKSGPPPVDINVSALGVGGRTRVYVVVGVKNAFNGGSTTYSLDAPGVGVVGNIDLATGGAEPLGADTAVPDPSALIPIFTQAGKHGHYTLPLPTLQMATYSRTEIVIFATTSGGVVIGYLGRDANGNYVSNGATEYRFDIGQSGVFDLNLKKADLPILFPNIIFLKAYYYVSNALGRSTNHSTTVSLNWGDLVDYLSYRGAVNVSEVGQSMTSGFNIVRNGDFDKNDPASTTNAKFWARWQPALGVLKPNNILGIRTNSPGVTFSATEHCCSIIDGSWYLVQNLGKVLKPGVSYCIQGVVRGSPSGFGPQLQAWLVKNNVVTSISDLTAFNLLNDVLRFPLSTLVGGGVSSTVYKNFGAAEECALAANLNDGTGIAADIWLVIGVPTGFAAPNLLKLDRIKLAGGGRQPTSYADNPLDVIGVEDTSGTGLLPGNVGDFSDSIYSPSGTQGGFPFGGSVGGGFL